GTTVLGYGKIQTSSGSSRPAGLAILESRQNNVLVSETAVGAAPLIRSGRIYSEIHDSISTAVAMANPNSEAVTVTFFFTAVGTDDPYGATTTTIPANR